MSESSRRSFFRHIGRSVASASPLILHAANKSGSARPVVGEGAHKYECIHDWGELPANIKYGNTHSVCEDSQGHIYIHHTVHKTSQSLDSVVVFDDKGKFVRSFGPMFHGGAHGMHLNRKSVV